MSEPNNTSCCEANERLSAYYDQELSPSSRTAVAEHTTGCNRCSRELEVFRSLSTLAAGLAQPAAPAELWQRIENQLDLHAEHSDRSERAGSLARLQWMRRPAVRFGFVAVAVILLAFGWLAYQTWFGRSSVRQMAAVFGEYLEEFPRDPDAAQQVLLAAYEGKAMDAEQAIRAVGYRPAVADGLPDGYSVEKTYLMKMPCCTCVQWLCRRTDGTTLAIFEHDDDEHASWFGNRPRTERICNGKPCSLLEMDGRIAASWKLGKRQLTLVGLRDPAEVDQLVAWFDDRRRIQPL